ncbi:MAG: hypothetical protein AAB439_01565 [Patescibacteria group bacterium]
MTEAIKNRIVLGGVATLAALGVAYYLQQLISDVDFSDGVSGEDNADLPISLTEEAKRRMEGLEAANLKGRYDFDHGVCKPTGGPHILLTMPWSTWREGSCYVCLEPLV